MIGVAQSSAATGEAQTTPIVPATRARRRSDCIARSFTPPRAVAFIANLQSDNDNTASACEVLQWVRLCRAASLEARPLYLQKRTRLAPRHPMKRAMFGGQSVPTLPV